ncbi:MAG: ABC transporter substrate-binding protein [Treponema sp.]|nr:ABC transporter substrate-binding protein [Treponema sp.]
MKKSVKAYAALLMLAVLTAGIASAAGWKRKKNKDAITASTSWTAAFADIAGVDSVTAIAPASMRHPPEYEITVDDILTVNKSKVFIYAGFERMMQTLGSSAGNSDTQMVQITCDNSIETVTAGAEKIAAVTGTQAKMKKRLAEYTDEIHAAAADLEKRGLKGARVLCNKNQTYLAKDLGLEIAAVFGPGQVTAAQIADAKAGGYQFIIDNVHNPVGQPLAEVAPDAKYIVWRNFPEAVERGALLKVVRQNIALLTE